MNCLYTIPLCNFGFAFRHATCVIVKDFGKALLKTKSSPFFFSYKLSERKPLFEIALCPHVLTLRVYTITTIELHRHDSGFPVLKVSSR